MPQRSWFQLVGPTGSAMGRSERHPAPKVARHHEPRARAQESQATKNSEGQEGLAQNQIGPTSVQGHALQTARVLGRKEVGRQGLGSSSASSSAPGSGNGRQRSAKLSRWYPVGAAHSCEKSNLALSLFRLVHWALCDVRHPSLQEASLDTQLVSYRAVTGREIQGPTTTKRRCVAMTADFSAQDIVHDISWAFSSTAHPRGRPD